MREKSLGPEEVIFKEKEMCDSVYIIMKGKSINFLYLLLWLLLINCSLSMSRKWQEASSTSQRRLDWRNLFF